MEQNWIRTSERLPPLNTDILGYWYAYPEDNGRVDRMWRAEQDFSPGKPMYWVHGRIQIYDVAYWMPLPPRPDGIKE